jgi:hypothetical protein
MSDIPFWHWYGYYQLTYPRTNMLNRHYVRYTPTSNEPAGSWALDCRCHHPSHPGHSPDHWLKEMECRSRFDARRLPNYFIPNPNTLVTTSQPLTFTLGTGTQILSSVLTSCLETNHELIFVTCFWAKKSQSRKDVDSILRSLSTKALGQRRVIQVRICFSSESIWKRLHPSRMKGKIHHPKSWKSLGLPREEEIKGLNLVVKSAFVPPFSVMHPKFILVDRQRAWIPSCNVSWESWLEGCIEVEGEITDKIYDFWAAFWGNRGAELPPLPLESRTAISNSPDVEMAASETEQSRDSVICRTPVSLTGIPTVLLPSPHNWNPAFLAHSPHITPFTTFLQHIFRAAKSNIYIQTPNLTCRLALKALVKALQRGVDIYIITSRRLMILEQIFTAGTFTEHEVRHLGRRYSQLKQKKKVEFRRYERALRRGRNLHEPEKLGSLTVGYYKPKAPRDLNEPRKSHFKFVCVDDEITVLGSGNMDRASWYTSQEIGIAFFSRDLAIRLSESVENALEDRVKYVCQSDM